LKDIANNTKYKLHNSTHYL